MNIRSFFKIFGKESAGHEFSPFIQEPSVPHGLQTYEQAASAKTNLIWKKLEETSVEQAIDHWLSTLGLITSNYSQNGQRLRDRPEPLAIFHSQDSSADAFKG